MQNICDDTLRCKILYSYEEVAFPVASRSLLVCLELVGGI